MDILLGFLSPYWTIEEILNETVGKKQGEWNKDFRVKGTRAMGRRDFVFDLLKKCCNMADCCFGCGTVD